jgi:hypothetical protein
VFAVKTPWATDLNPGFVVRMNHARTLDAISTSAHPSKIATDVAASVVRVEATTNQGWASPLRNGVGEQPRFGWRAVLVAPQRMSFPADAVAFDIHLSTIRLRKAVSLSVIRITVTPVPVDGLLPGVQLNESAPLMVLGLIPLVRAVFVGVPVVIVLVALVVVTLVVLALSIFVIPIVLWAGSGHHRNRCSKGSSQKKRTKISVSTVHVISFGARLTSTESR